MLIGIRVTVFALLVSAIALLGRPAAVEASEAASAGCFWCGAAPNCSGGWMNGGYTCAEACLGSWACAIT